MLLFGCIFLQFLGFYSNKTLNTNLLNTPLTRMSAQSGLGVASSYLITGEVAKHNKRFIGRAGKTDTGEMASFHRLLWQRQQNLLIEATKAVPPYWTTHTLAHWSSLLWKRNTVEWSCTEFVHVNVHAMRKLHQKQSDPETQMYQWLNIAHFLLSL